ncbi:unnamed protein product [Cochlearia groenlandica]
MGITVLLLDAKESAIHGFITAARSDQYRPYLKTGSIVRVSRFEVARCARTYKLTDHPFLIRFIPQTIIEDVMVDCPLIGRVKFMLRTIETLKVLANTNLELPDVVGQIQFVQGADLTQPGVTTRVVVRFLIEPHVVVYLSLWDDASSVFRGLLQSGDMTQSMMIVTTVNPKLFGGNLYLNSIPGTTFTFDPTLEPVSLFAASLGEPITTAFTCTDTKDGIKKKEVVSIRELNKFITDSNEQTQEADFICTARVVEVLPHNGWSFVSCTGCSKKLDRTGTSLSCARCAKPNMSGILRYRVELCVDDGADSAILAGKEFAFHIRVTPFNFSPSHRTFTVSAIHDNIPPETFSTEPPQDSGASGSKPSKTVANSVVQETHVPLPATGSQSARKRPRE